MPGPPPDEAQALGGDLGGPFGQQAGQTARVLVVAGHVNSGLGALHILGLLCRGDGAAAADAGQQVRGVVGALDAGGSEENDRVLDLLPAKTRERLDVLGEQAQNSAVRAAEEWFVLVSEGSRLEFLISHKLNY